MIKSDYKDSAPNDDNTTRTVSLTCDTGFIGLKHYNKQPHFVSKRGYPFQSRIDDYAKVGGPEMALVALIQVSV